MALILEWRLVITVACGTRYQIVITKRHLKIILSTFGAIFRRKKYHKWPDGAYITVSMVLSGGRKRTRGQDVCNRRVSHSR